MKIHLKLAAIALLATGACCARAGIIEDLLAVPAIQSLLGRIPEVQATVQRCADATYRARNTAICQRAEEAARLANMPPVLRTVLATPASAVSIGELCLAVQSGLAQNSYLCAELAKADIGFKALMDQRRQTTLPGAAPQPETGHG